MNCRCCHKPKADDRLISKNSVLMPTWQMFVCVECQEHEPREIILINAATDIATVSNLIRENKYCGEIISAKEIIA